MSYIADPEGLIWSNKTNKFLKSSSNGRGYLHVVLRVNGKSLDTYVHRFIAENLIPNPSNLPEVNHKDGDKSNNCILNLEWVSSSGNKNHAVSTGLRQLKKLSCHSQDGILLRFDSAKIAAEHFGLVAKNIRNACAGKNAHKHSNKYWRWE